MNNSLRLNFKVNSSENRKINANMIWSAYVSQSEYMIVNVSMIMRG